MITPLRIALHLALTLFVAVPLLAETPVSSIEFGPADHQQNLAGIATNGDIYLAAWATTSSSSMIDVRAARISASGELLDQVAIEIVSGSRNAWPRLVAWTGRFFIVGYLDRTDRGELVRLVKIDPDGRIAGETVVERMWPLALTCGGGRCLLTGLAVQQDRRFIEVMVLDADARALGERRMVADATGNGQVIAESATNGDGFLLTWQDTDGGSPPLWILRAVTVSSDGMPGAVQELPAVRQFLGGHALAATGRGYLVVWHERESWDRTAYVTYRLNDDGTPVGARAKLPLTDPLQGPFVFLRSGDGFVAVLKTGSNYPHRTVLFALNADGELRTPSREIPQLSTAFGFGAAAMSGGFLVVSSELSGNSLDLYARTFTSSGEPAGGPAIVAWSARAQRLPAVIWDGSHIVTAWEEANGPRTEIRMSKMRTGAAPDFELTIGASAVSQRMPAVAFNGTEYLVAWVESSEGGASLFARRIARSGMPIDSTPALLTSNYCSDRAPGVTSDGNDFLVVWTDCSEPTRIPRAFTARVVNGGVTDPVALSAVTGRAEGGTAVWIGSHYVVAWINRQKLLGCGIASCWYASTIRVSRLTREGELLDPEGITVAPESPVEHPVVTAGAGGVLVSWLGEGTIAGARLRSDGTSEPPRHLVDRTPWLQAFSMAAVGTNFVATYTPYDTGDIVTATITPAHIDGGVAATPSRLTTPDVEANPVVVAISSTDAAIAYQRIAREPQYGNANRVFVKTLFAGDGPRRRRAVGNSGT